MSGYFRKDAPRFSALAFIDNGSSANFISDSLCNKLRANPKKLLDDTKKYQGPTGEPLQLIGECPLQVCWQNSGSEVKAKITFKVVIGLTFEIIFTFEMAKKTQIDLVAGPHPDQMSINAVAPISSVILPIHKAPPKASDAKLKAEKKAENAKKEAEKKQLHKAIHCADTYH